MTPELLGQIGGGIGLVLASAVAAFRLGVRRGGNGTPASSTSPRWHHEDRELMRRLIAESNDALRDHLDRNTEALNSVRSSVDRMSGFLQGRLSAGD